jgi:HEAT repeat protein
MVTLLATATGWHSAPGAHAVPARWADLLAQGFNGEELAASERTILRALERDDASRTTIAEALESQGFPPLPAAWSLLVTPGMEPGSSAQWMRARTSGLAVLAELLHRSGRPRRKSFLTSLAECGLPEEQWNWVLGSLGEQASAFDIQLILSLHGLQRQATPLTDGDVDEHLRRTLSMILARDPPAITALSAEVALAPHLHGAMALAVLDGLSGARALAALGRLLEYEAVEPAAALAAVERVARRSLPPFDSYLLRDLRELARNGTGDVRCAALRALGALDDRDAVALFLDGLQTDQPEVRSASNAALVELSGLNFGLDVRRWTAWYGAERRWWQEKSESVLASLTSDSRSEVLAALGEVVTHRLDRTSLSRAVADVLQNDSADLRRLACMCLGQLGSLVATPQLVERLADLDPTVQQAAHDALQLLLDTPLPPDPQAWSDYLNARTIVLR